MAVDTNRQQSRRRDTVLPVNEVFSGVVQGEGPYCGRACAFIRLGWCNLHCPVCDTKPTWDTSRYDLAVTCPDRTPEEVVAELPAGTRMVVVTGGEPLLWQRSGAFGRMLDVLAGRRIAVHVETNGTIVPDEADTRIVHYSVSPKLAAMGGADPWSRRIKPAAIAAFARVAAQGRACFKFVVSNPAGVEEVAAFAREHGLDPAWVWVMPEAQDTDTLLARQPEITAAGADAGFNVSTRLHMIAGCR